MSVRVLVALEARARRRPVLRQQLVQGVPQATRVAQGAWPVRSRAPLRRLRAVAVAARPLNSPPVRRRPRHKALLQDDFTAAAAAAAARVSCVRCRDVWHVQRPRSPAAHDGGPVPFPLRHDEPRDDRRRQRRRRMFGRQTGRHP